MDIYKFEEIDQTPQTRYDKFYCNKEMNRNFDESIISRGNSNIDRSKYNNPYNDILFLIQWFSNQTDSPMDVIKSLSITIESCIDEVSSIILETNFIPFLLHAVVETPSSQVELKTSLVRLIWKMLGNFKSLRFTFFREGLLPIATNFFQNDSIITVRIYSIFSIIYLFQSFGYTNRSDFEKYITITMLLNTYNQLNENINKRMMQEKMRKNRLQLLKGIINLASRISYYPLTRDESNSAFRLSYICLVEPLYREKKSDKDWAKHCYTFALQTLSYVIENGCMNFNDFFELKMFDIIARRLKSATPSHRILSCDIFLALFENKYFMDNKHVFDVGINDLLQYIDDFKEERGAYIRLLSSIIRNDQINGFYINQFFYSEQKNSKGIKTICHYLLHEGNFEVTASSAHCLIELFRKLTPDMVRESLEIVNASNKLPMEINLLDSLVKIIQFGLDDDIELSVFALEIIYNLIEFTRKDDTYDTFYDILSKSTDGFELFLDLSQNDDQRIRFLSERIQNTLQ